MENILLDKRKKEFFVTDNAFVDKYAKFVKAPGIVVYSALLRHSNKDSKAFPGIRHIAKEMGISYGRAVTGVKSLQKYNIIDVFRNNGINNIYTLLDTSQWKRTPKSSWSNQSVKVKRKKDQ